MKFSDLLRLSINNLKRRKLRTFLTVLGVIIGTASIVVMVSLGIGQAELQTESIESYASLTTIDVWQGGMFGDGSSEEQKYITDEVLESFEHIPHVTGTSPILRTNVIAKQGVYEANLQLMGVSREYLEQIDVGEGSIPLDEKNLEFLYGNSVIRDFSNSKTGEGYYTNYEDPDVDLMGKPVFIIFDTSAYYQSQAPQSQDMSQDSGQPKVKPPKKYIVPTAGLVKGSPDDWGQYSYSTYCNVEALKSKLKSIYRKEPIPGQPTDKKGKALNYFVYDNAAVYVDDMDNVKSVQDAIAAMGYQANSNMEWVEQNKKTMQIQQAVLGGIGAVSLLVAAIGIANTMMMSIYERTKEIGVMKVLGCDMGNIRDMFLIESGCIGLMGGTAGIGISYGVSFIINKLYIRNQMMNGYIMPGMDGPGNISRIPLWLILTALVFAVIIGMLAGFFPSRRAMKLSPLSAIRNE